MTSLFSPSRRPWRHTLAAVLIGATVLGLGGCASLQQVQADVMGFGGWPAERAPGLYQFERLPSQQQAGPAQDTVETAAAEALAAQGFVREPVAAAPAPDAASAAPTASTRGEATLLVQVGVRGYRVVDPWLDAGWSGRRSAWGMTGWWGSGGHHSTGLGLGFGWTSSPPRDVQEVALLLIDRRSHEVLYEGRARTELRGTPAVLRALFAATLDGFPTLPGGTREVTVPLEAAPSSPH
jgi:hypothetical protein